MTLISPSSAELPYPSTSSTIATRAQPSDFFARPDHPDNVKKVILKHLIQKSIAENTVEQIVTGVEIVDMKSQARIVSHNSDTEHFAASINKLPVTLLVLHDIRAKKIDLNQTVTWMPSDVRAGAGVYDQPGAPLQAPVKDVIYDLLNRSGNTAVRILVNNLLGGAATVNQRFSTMPELSHTRLQPLDTNRFYVGNTAPRDAMWTIEQLLKKQDAYGRFIKNALQTNIYVDVSVRSQLAGNDFIVLVNKVALLDDVEGNNRHDVGIIYNTKTHRSYGYSLLTTAPYASETATIRAEQSLKDIGRYTLRYSGDKNKPSQAVRAKAVPQTEKRTLY